MNIISVNIGSPRAIKWKIREGETGIFKFPVDEPIFLGKEGVRSDSVMNREAHGGIDKACYLFSENNYAFWKELYPALDWQWGMFGENITVSDFDESSVRIGDIFTIGDVVIQVSQPRKPCWKQDYRFNSDLFSKQFIEQQKCGFYVRVLTEGFVKKGDEIELIETHKNSLTIQEVFGLLYLEKEGEAYIDKALQDPNIAASCLNDLMKKWKK